MGGPDLRSEAMRCAANPLRMQADELRLARRAYQLGRPSAFRILYVFGPVA